MPHTLVITNLDDDLFEFVEEFAAMSEVPVEEEVKLIIRDAMLIAQGADTADWVLDNNPEQERAHAEVMRLRDELNGAIKEAYRRGCRYRGAVEEIRSPVASAQVFLMPIFPPKIREKYD